MTFAEPAAAHLGEPILLFGGDRQAADPKTGLSLFGAYAAPKSPINIGIIGDNTTVTQAERVLRRITRRIPGSDKYPTLRPGFPGISLETQLRCDLNVADEWICTIRGRDVDDLEAIKSKSRRIGTAIRLITKYMAAVEDRDEMPDVFVCAIPQKMFRLCTGAGPQGRAGPGLRRGAHSDTGTEKLFNYFTDDDLEKYEQAVMDETADNFHNMLKAQAMRFTPRTQMIKPGTLDALTSSEPQGQNRLQDGATVAWNLATALLYKSGCRLWRPARMPGGTCFVGVSFYRTRRMLGGAMGTSMAQVFTPEGEGFVMRGDEFPWAGRGPPHLDGASAEKLLRGAVEMYKRQTGGRPPGRIVLHKSSKYTGEELEGFKRAAGDVDYDFVAILGGSGRIAVFREGEHPVLRGTMVELPGGRWLLYTTGYVPFLGLYPGPHTPNPLEIVEHFGDAPIRQVCQEILMLTKLNWNNADFSSRLPITLQFARKVGEIMKEAPEVMKLAHKYMYYM